MGWLNSLAGRLALTLLGLLALAGAGFVALNLAATHLYLHEVSQKLNRDLAAHIAQSDWLMREGEVNQAALKELFDTLMTVNPSIEVYLTDTRGRLLAYSAPAGKVVRERIDLEPVRTFLEGDSMLPVYGDDPRARGRQKVFSAAPVIDGGERTGYLYVVLGGELFDSAVQRVEGSHILRLSVGVALGILVVTFLVGLWAFSRLTRRLRRLSVAMEGFQAGGEGDPVPAPVRSGRGDEIDRLAGSFGALGARINDQIRQLERADANRRELVANVSHDLRTPLASLQGYLETLKLKEGELSAEARREYLDTALAHGQRLVRLVSELFELATLEAEDKRLQREPIALGELAQDVVQKFRLQAEGKGLIFEMRVPAAPPLAEGDIALIERALDNLIDNAIKYTPEGGRVGLSLEGVADGVAVRVSDTGPGIPEDELPHVFDRFFRGGRSYPERPEGTGLGLAIARRILVLHGSDLEVSSQPGQGTTFAFVLPVAPA
ncbi:MAG TPA: ATP-binding protein [Gammaproteobacteria bacterium]|nr:ATP-binding protein [Gammaproteobacteria bacterium]